MAFEGIKVSPAALMETAGKIDSINTSLDDKLKEINKTMDQTDGAYISKDGTAIRDAMNAMKPRFEEYKNVIASYAKFLRQAAESYKSTEDARMQNANQFKE